MKYRLIISVCLFLLSPGPGRAQADPEYDRNYKLLLQTEQQLLRQNHPGRVQVIDFTHIKTCAKSQVQYLGTMRTNRGRVLKIVTSFFVYATSSNNCHAWSSLKIFDSRYRFVGQYYGGMPNDLPDLLKAGRLYFTKADTACPAREKVVISFRNGLPTKIFLPCTDQTGDFMDFDSAEK